MRDLSPDDMVVVTGAAQGIGRAIAQRLAIKGIRLALWDVSGHGLAETAAMCSGPEIVCHEVDVSDEGAVGDAARKVTAWGGVPFGLVNNAAIFPRALLLDADAEHWRQVLAVNLIGGFICGKAFGQAMIGQQRGAIVNISSSMALSPLSRCAAYAASKAGIIALTKTMALEFAPSVRVNCVLPGLIETAQPLADIDLDTLQQLGKLTPMGRVGQPDDIAKVVCFALGSEAGYMTGQCLSVNGGSVMMP